VREHVSDLLRRDAPSLLRGAEGDVLANGSGKEKRALHDHSYGAAQPKDGNLTVITAVEIDRTLGGLVESIKQTKKGAFSGAAWADNCKYFSGLHGEANVLE
jgi:hypothetical protein